MEIVLSCPQCGAEVDLNEDASVFRCRYCDSTLKPTGRNEVESFFFPPKGTMAQVGKALVDTLWKQGRGIRVIGGQILYAPYWRVRGQIFQWVFGRKYGTTQAGANSFDDFKRARASPFHRTFPAFNHVQVAGHITGLEGSGREAVPLLTARKWILTP